MKSLIKQVQELKLTKFKKGETVLTKDFEKFVLNLMQIMETAKELDKLVRARLLKEFEKDNKLKKIGGNKISATKVTRSFRKIAGDPREMLKDKELKRFIEVNYKINSKVLNEFIKNQKKARKRVELPDGIAETFATYISYREL